MKCPYCNEEMKRGYIQSASPIFWGEEKHKIFMVESREGEFRLSEGVLKGSFAIAFHCKTCKKIIMNKL